MRAARCINGQWTRSQPGYLSLRLTRLYYRAAFLLQSRKLRRLVRFFILLWGEGLGDSFEEKLFVDRLGQETIGAGVQGLLCVIRFIRAADDDGRSPFIGRLLQPARDLKAVPLADAAAGDIGRGRVMSTSIRSGFSWRMTLKPAEASTAETTL